MKQFLIRMLAMVIVQPLSMYCYLRVFEMRFFASAGLAALTTMAVGFGIYFVQMGTGRDKKRL